MVRSTDSNKDRRRGEPNQQRGRDRRLALLRAALELLAEGGVKAVTHRAVAARAGLPLASTTYYFTSIDQLTEEALLLAVEERVTLLEPFTRPGARPEMNAEQLARAYLSTVLARPRFDIVAQLEIYLEAARNPALQEAASGAIVEFEVLAERALALVGPRNPRNLAIAVSAMLDGFALHRVVRPLPAEDELEIMLDALRALFIAHLADDAERTDWRARLGHEFRRIGSPPDPAAADQPRPSG